MIKTINFIVDIFDSKWELSILYTENDISAD